MTVLIPALNEEATVGEAVRRVPKDIASEIIVIDNGSTDRTAQVAAEAGAKVVREPRRGFGNACRKGIENADSPDCFVFLDADLSDSPERMAELVNPIREGRADFVLGSRGLGAADLNEISPAARWGNRLACFLIRILLGYRYTDLAPFRAIRAESLRKLGMSNPGSGWPVEMQTRAVQEGLRIIEVPMPYFRRKHGKSKVSGSIRGIFEAGWRILSTIFICYLRYGRPKKNRCT